MKKFVLVLTLFLLVISARFVFAQTCSNESECNSLIEQYTNQIQSLQGQARTLKNQIAQFDAQIKLTTLKITDTQNKILLLGGRIDQLEVSLDSLTRAFSGRAVETYKLSRFENNFMFVLAASDMDEAVARFHYLAKVQEEDRSLLIQLQEAQTMYKGEKKDQENLQAELKAQQANLNAQKAAKNNLLKSTQNNESKYQSLLAQARAQLNAFRSFVSRQGGASILSNQTKCDGWGCYYNQRDSSWGNISLGGSPYSMAEYGCLVTSVSMLASHYGKSIKPNDIAANSGFFVPGTGYLYHSAQGMPFTITTASKSVLDSELAAGRPVIAGLYGGPDHFIVIVKKEGDKYIMHDPFIENGGNRPLSDKYSVSDITSLRLVTFN
jgi:peptidoglycan hydrolase CwlO-like protein